MDHARPDVLYSIGHSTRRLDEFIGLLGEFQIRVLVDIRRFPGSRRLPHFNRDQLEPALAGAGIEYLWLESLGGRRSSPKDTPSPNAGLRHAAFRAYADYMLTDEFRRGVDVLLSQKLQGRTAMMCAEAVYWRCHRRLVSDFLLARGVTVRHILGAGQLRPHKLTDSAVIADGQVTYPPLWSTQSRYTR